MSIEFLAAVVVDAAVVRALAAELPRDGRFELLPSEDPARMLFRVTKQARRVKWPQDIELHVTDREIYVAVHSADRDDREAFIRSLEAVLAAHGHPARFDEL